MTGPSDLLGPKLPTDEISLARLRRVLEHRFGAIPILEHHLSLLDSRGVLYATHTAGIWENDLPEMFFGVVRHVVRTQCEGPPPDPDVEGWLAAGRPDGTDLGSAWDLINLGRYGAEALPPEPRTDVLDPQTAHLDAMLRDWPHLATFVTSYARVEHFIVSCGITLPPLTA